MAIAHTSTPSAAPPTPAAALVEDEPSGSTAKRCKVQVDPFVREVEDTTTKHSLPLETERTTSSAAQQDFAVSCSHDTAQRARSVAILAQGYVLYGRFSLVGTARSYDFWQMFFSCPDGNSLMCGLHGPFMKRLVCSTGIDLKSHEQAARQCRRSGLISSRIAKKLLALDAAFNVFRHVNSVRAERLLDELAAEVHVKTTDPASYTVYADAATFATTAAPAIVNELAVSTRVVEYVAPARVATLLEPPVPSVHFVQVPHVHVVQNTIETQQLQILEKYVGFPASRSDVTCKAPAHVIEHVPIDTCAAPARLAPAPMTECIAQAHVGPSHPQFFYWRNFLQLVWR